ncbi:protein SCAR2-like [Rutidosis leptorrhynchoides]|uniref:protein SCAR2-like n=1 Tax=Rutidosis leptorrhynchoides TaxID=125765 RepID=UPI003A9A392E
MPFSRYEIRNEFSLADPELYKSADKDDPEALLEGVAMAGLVGVLRQLGDLAEFAAEIFHGLHEEVMVTAARGHGLLVRVQQVESDFPSIERAFLSQTRHSSFFSSSGICWHPNLQVEQNLITNGDLPRFVMDSYEESRGPPRLFLLDKFDVAGAGACLKRYTDPSFFKMETASYEMMSAETQRDKKIRKTKKKGSQWKNGETPDVFQPSHVKLHQLLLEERLQNGISEPARRVKLKKRDIKFPFDTETGKGYMEILLSSSPEDKLVHEVPVGYSPPRFPTNSSDESGLEPAEVKMVNSALVNPYESPIVDKTVSREHMDYVLENVPEMHGSDLSTSSADFQGNIKKHISVNREHKEDGIEDNYKSDDAASEIDNFMDALATMELEVETDAELRANCDPTTMQLQSHPSDSQFASDDESSPIKKKLTSFSYSDTTNTSTESMSPRCVISSPAFASTEIPFRPRVSPNQSFDKCIKVGDISAAEILPADQGEIFEESKSKESASSEMSSNDCVDVNGPKRITETEIDAEEIIASPSYVETPQWEADNEDNNDDSSLVMSHVEEHPFGSSEEADISEISDDVLESKSCAAEYKVSYSSENELEYKDREKVSVVSESVNADDNANVYHFADDRNGDDNLQTVVDKKELEEESKSVNLETNDPIPASVSDDGKDNQSKVLSTREDTELENNEYTELSTAEEHAENGSFINQSGIVQRSSEPVENGSSEQDSTPSASYDHSNTKFIDSIPIQNNGFESDVDKPFAEIIIVEFGEQRQSNGQSVIPQELDPNPAAFNDHSKIQDLDGISISSFPSIRGFVNKNDVDNPSVNLETLHSETLVATDNIDHDVLNNQLNAQYPDSRPLISVVLTDDEELKASKVVDQDVQSKSPDQDDQIDEPKAASFILNQDVSTQDKADQPHTCSVQLEIIDAHNQVDQETHVNHLSESKQVDQERYQLEQAEVFQDSSMVHLSQLSSQVISNFDMLPQLAPINMEEMPPLPPLPPMQWRMGKLPDSSLVPNGSQHDNHHFTPSFPQIESHPSLYQNDNSENNESEHDHKDFNTWESDSLAVSSEHNAMKFEEKVIPAPPFARNQSANVSTSGREIIRPSSTSSLPPINEEGPNGIRPMKILRPRTPLIDAVAAHDKSLLKKVSERAVPLFPKEEERDTLLELIRAKSVNLKPAVQTRPSIQGPSTNLRVAAILEKANAIRQAFAGSDDDEDDDDDRWSDS